jgi:hypothetical protein
VRNFKTLSYADRARAITSGNIAVRVTPAIKIDLAAQAFVPSRSSPNPPPQLRIAELVRPVNLSTTPCSRDLECNEERFGFDRVESGRRIDRWLCAEALIHQ